MSHCILMVAGYMGGLKKAWRSLGFQVFEDAIIKLSPAEIENRIGRWKAQRDIAYVFSFDFLPAIAEACFRHQLSYISWIVDSPHSVLWSKAAFYPTNVIFHFDYLEYQELREAGNEQIYYLPLRTDSPFFTRMIEQTNEQSVQRFRHDVAFMGNLYDKEPHNLYDKISHLPTYVSGYLEGIIAAQRKVWGCNLVHSAIMESVWRALRENIILELESSFDSRVYQSFVEGIIHKKIAQLERKEVCSYLAEHFDFVLYSGSDTTYDQQIRNGGYIDYLKEMPLVFRHSKININITLHGINTGIPLRVLDILACGGFCLTNYQEEIGTYFEDGVELVMYSDFQDMYEKISYYLVHEEERKAIAQAGYEKIKKQFEYIHGVEEIVTVLGNVRNR